MLSFGGIGTTSIIGDRLDRLGQSEKDIPSTYDKHGTQGQSFEDPAYFAHLTDQAPARARIRRYGRTGNIEELLTPHLQAKIEQEKPETIDIQVQTTGRKAHIRSKGPYGRKLHGWQPTPAEIKRLSDYGSIGATSDIVSTNVGITDVSTDDLSEIAELPFVLEIATNPTIKHQNEDNSQNSVTRQSSELTTGSTEPSIEDLKSSNHSDFDSVSHTLDSGLRVGFFIAGYDTSGDETRYDTNWGKATGLNTNLAKSFLDSQGWKGNNQHATNVLNTTAQILYDYKSSDNHLVPLRVYDYSEGCKASDFANAVDYAVKNDISAAITSTIITDNISACPSTVCAELESYSSAGYVMDVAAGNSQKEAPGTVDDPAQSYYSVGVGGYRGSCSGGREHATDDSQYGDITYEYCAWCYDEGRTAKFSPDVYSCYRFHATPAEDKPPLKGTSFAAPIAAAATAIDASANNGDSYATRLDRYHSMNNYDICTSTEAQLGQVLHAPDII